MSSPSMPESTALMPTQQSSQQLAPISMPQPVNKRALREYLALISDPEALQLQNELAGAYDRAVKALLGANDIQVEGNREFKKKSAWQKLGRYFGISTQIIEQTKGYINDATTGESVFVATCSVRAFAPWGQAGDAVGACGTDEESGRRKITIADAIATAQTRATNRGISNLIAMGEVSAEELSRGASTEAQQQSVEQMTLADAKLVAFPWKTPAKYRDKPLGDISHAFLHTILDAIGKEIREKGETYKRLELAQGCRLVIADIEAHPDQYPEAQRPKDEGDDDKVGAAGTAAAEQPSNAQTYFVVIDNVSKLEHLTILDDAQMTLCDLEIRKKWARGSEAVTADQLLEAMTPEQACAVCVQRTAPQTARAAQAQS